MPRSTAPIDSNESASVLSNNNDKKNVDVDCSCHAPTSIPPFSVAQLRATVPAHCFERSHVKSFTYLFVDIVIVVAFMLIARYIDSFITDEKFGSAAPLLRYVFWSLYWIAQGCVMTGLWVIGHECGHGGFSSSELVNDIVGFITHSCLLVPYFSWKISHRRHHANTGNLERDEVFVPGTRTIVDDDHPLKYSAPIRVFHVITTMTVGWFLYLLVNATGRPYPRGKWVNHFVPSSPIFTPKEGKLVLLSDIGLFIVIGILYQLAQSFSFIWLMKMYLIPYLIVNFWLVLITLLQHTDITLPHYNNDEWDWLRGALATVDRDYGFLNIVFHHIADTHVTHHLFSAIPHYHAQEATEALKPILGKYYRVDHTPIASALWSCFRECQYVMPAADRNGVYWFHSPIGQTCNHHLNIKQQSSKK